MHQAPDDVYCKFPYLNPFKHIPGSILQAINPLAISLGP